MEQALLRKGLATLLAFFLPLLRQRHHARLWWDAERRIHGWTWGGAFAPSWSALLGRLWPWFFLNENLLLLSFPCRRFEACKENFLSEHDQCGIVFPKVVISLNLSGWELLICACAQSSHICPICQVFGSKLSGGLECLDDSARNKKVWRSKGPAVPTVPL